MVVIILPDWTIELEEKLDKVILDMAVKNHIDITAVQDSRAIEKGKNLISNALVRLYDNYNVEDRIELTKFAEDMKKTLKKERKK